MREAGKQRRVRKEPVMSITVKQNKQKNPSDINGEKEKINS